MPGPGRLAREVLGLLRLLLSPARDRADRVYAVLGADNHLGHEARWLNLGYWDGARTADEAGAALAVRVGEQAGLARGQRVLDVGFGFGDGPMLWAERFGARVSGLNVTPGQVRVALERATARDLDLDLRVGSATRMPYADASFDRVVAVESAFHFAPRTAFFAEARRVLVPGGRLALADYVPLPRGRPTWRSRLDEAVGRALWQIPRANMVPAEVYAAQLQAAGFVDVRVESIRDRVFEPFRAFARTRQADPDVVARASPLLRAAWRSSHSPHERMDYVIATGAVSER